MVKEAARRGDGPWGDAIEYHYKNQGKRQADVVDGTGMTANVVSRASRGFDVRTDTLRKFAEFFQVPLEEILVPPTQRLDPQAEHQALTRVVGELRRTIDHARRAKVPTPGPKTDSRILGLARRLARLSPQHQRRVIDQIKHHERAEKRGKTSHESDAAAGSASIKPDKAR